MATRLIELVENLPAARIVLVGDFMLDKYIFGSTSRVSPEAPIPVLRYQREEFRLGGAGFVMAALGRWARKSPASASSAPTLPARNLNLASSKPAPMSAAW